MKIGVLTYHGVPNFGAQLQTFSTVCYLRKQGHTPVVLNWYPQDLEDGYASYIPKEQFDCHRDFASKCFPLSSLCRKENDLLEEIEKLQVDAILLGSDALFKYIPMKRRWMLKMGKYKPRILHVITPSVERLHGNPFFAGFVHKLKESIPAATYAVSSQNCPYDDMTFFEKRLMKKYLDNLECISVRDDWTQKMITSITGRYDIRIYPDPVFAFNQNVQEFVPTKAEIFEKYNIKQDYVLLSFWTGRCSKEYVRSLANEIRHNNLFPITLPTPSGNNDVGDVFGIRQPLSPLEWYALIKYASGYIGELMHPIVVCLHNSVPCFSFDEYGGKIIDKVVFPKQKPYCQESSKIYHIMHAAGFDANRVSNEMMKEYPEPALVVDRILRFDRNKCEGFAQTQYQRYIDGMMDVLSHLQQ